MSQVNNRLDHKQKDLPTTKTEVNKLRIIVAVTIFTNVTRCQLPL